MNGVSSFAMMPCDIVTREIARDILSPFCHHASRRAKRLFVERFSPKRCERLWKAAGLLRLKFHDLRKTFASLLAQKWCVRANGGQFVGLLVQGFDLRTRYKFAVHD